MCNLSCSILCSFNFYILSHCLTRNTSHNMNSEFQSLIMYIFCNRTKTFTTCRRRKSIRCRNYTPKFIHTKICKKMIMTGICSGFIPLNVTYNIFPSVLFQMFCHIIGIFQKNFFRHRRPITIPAIPSHGRSFCKYIFIHVYFSSSSQNKCQVSHCSIINTLRVSYLTLILFHFILILSRTILHTLPAALSPVIFHLQLHTCNLRLTDKSL